ncbi:hypothetical protein LY04_01997 [Oceanimonas baumannii]|uniref:Transcriptional regulator n=1 Tax=Oceanimonas baumannii TaxID=129578 RepID=A0ABY2EXW9_9GAMM|nr:hypothetical protein LY04_01997 [Oceanimonas baumannii]
MVIHRKNGSRPSAEGPADWFTGCVRKAGEMIAQPLHTNREPGRVAPAVL